MQYNKIKYVPSIQYSRIKTHIKQYTAILILYQIEIIYKLTSVSYLQWILSKIFFSSTKVKRDVQVHSSLWTKEGRVRRIKQKTAVNYVQTFHFCYFYGHLFSIVTCKTQKFLSVYSSFK